MATPMPARCSDVIKAIADPRRDKILAENPFLVGVPISAAAAIADRERHERLAAKYGVKIPERPPEKSLGLDDLSRGYYVRQIPVALGGDLASESSLASRMKKPMAFWWPIQPEEWELDYWSTRGFNIFVVIEGGALGGAELPIMNYPVFHAFLAQIKQRCELIATLPTTRPLFFEKEVTVYRFRSTPGGHTGRG